MKTSSVNRSALLGAALREPPTQARFPAVPDSGADARPKGPRGGIGQARPFARAANSPRAPSTDSAARSPRARTAASSPLSSPRLTSSTPSRGRPSPRPSANGLAACRPEAGASRVNQLQDPKEAASIVEKVMRARLRARLGPTPESGTTPPPQPFGETHYQEQMAKQRPRIDQTHRFVSQRFQDQLFNPGRGNFGSNTLATHKASAYHALARPFGNSFGLVKPSALRENGQRW